MYTLSTLCIHLICILMVIHILQDFPINIHLDILISLVSSPYKLHPVTKYPNTKYLKKPNLKISKCQIFLTNNNNVSPISKTQ